MQQLNNTDFCNLFDQLKLTNMKHIYKSLSNVALVVSFIILAANVMAQNAWINEIHYDNGGTDEGEFIEVVIENAGSYNLADFQLDLYNGNGGSSYNTKTLDDFTEGTTSGNFTFYHYEYPTNGIQNGAPDGMALSYQGTLISGQFLSYEGTFDATDGPANGVTSTDIGVEESSSTNAGESLQLSGNGTSYDDFVWNDPATETPGDLNNDQSFSGPDPEPTNYPTDFSVTATGLSSDLEWTDATGDQLPSAYLIKGSTSLNITPPVDGVPEDDDLDFSDGEGAVNVSYGDEAYTFYMLESETEYFFKIYPYSNAGSNINYKTDGSAPTDNDTTDFAINTNDFENGDFGTWTTYSVASDKDWEVLDYGGALGTDWFAQMNGYNENELSNDWLISPSMNLNEYNNDKMLFWTSWKYGSADDELMLKYSTDYTGGDPTSANWTELTFTKPANSEEWENSGFVDLSSISGEDVYVAFQYLSSGSPRRWSVDQIDITGEVFVPVINVTSPMGGDIWEQGSTHNIEWEASNTLELVKIELTTDASSGNPTWELLTDNIPANQGYWTWNISPDQTTSYDCQIRITDYESDAEGLSEIFWIVEPYVAPDIVITEIMYNPPESGNDTLEFVELFNNSDETVDLDGYYFNAGFEFEFENTEIEAGEYLVIAVDSNAMFNTFGIHTFQWEDGGLSNSGELIEFVNFDGFTVDSVRYDDAEPWPVEPDGSGPSLDFCDPDLDNGIPDYWSASEVFAAINADNDTIWASPGEGCNTILAMFEADTTIVIVGGEVNYTDLSTGDPTSWAWSFEGGTPDTSNQQSPSAIVYNEEGSFMVSLTVSNENGSSTETMDDYIHVGYAPVANFEASDTVIEVNETVDFTDLSENSPETWEWTFEGGDPATSTEQNPDGIMYSAMGSYDVTLTVTSMFGSSTLTMEDYIEVGPVGIDENMEYAVSIYPNPSDGNLTVETMNAQNIEVYSILGELKYKQEVEQKTTKLNLTDLDKGVYFIRIITDDQSYYTERIVIK